MISAGNKLAAGIYYYITSLGQSIIYKTNRSLYFFIVILLRAGSYCAGQPCRAEMLDNRVIQERRNS